MKSDKEIVGTLLGFDDYVNMVLEDVSELEVDVECRVSFYSEQLSIIRIALRPDGDIRHLLASLRSLNSRRCPMAAVE